MKLKIDRLEKVRQRGSRIIARCPACAELDRDRAGDNLVIFDNGCFACAACQQDRIGYIYPQGIKIRQPWGVESSVRFAWACGRATEPWRCTYARSRPGVRHYLITEGESDLIALADALNNQITSEDGIALVASPGTAFREEWARLFAGCCVSLFFDNDDAGTAALLHPFATQVRNLHLRRS